MNRLDGKVALITGGANGQGAVEAKLFVEAGAQVIITDIAVEAGKQVADSIGEGCRFIEHDVTSREAWQSVIESVVSIEGRIDILVNNAGLFHVAGVEETSPDTWDQIIAINQTSVFLGMHYTAPVMKKQQSGCIINISSAAGLGASKALAYSAAKWAVRGLSKSAAIDLAPYGIRVNSVHPGLIDTPMIDAFGDDRATMTKRVPLGYIGSCEEVAKLVRFIASNDASYSTGHEFMVDGGLKS